mgnify:CR=1 FL=1|jgi:hypothetical protein
MNKRVQLSLLFSDTDVYEGLIVPWKANRELNPLIIKLLSAYYYSDEIRGLVDTFGEEEIICEDTTNFSQVIENAKSTLAYMSMLTEGARTVLADGIDDINNIASATGGEPAKESKFGFSMPSFGDALNEVSQGVSNEPASQEGKASMQTADTSGNMVAVNERINGLEGQIASLTETVANLSKLLLTSGVTVKSNEPVAESVEEPVESVEYEAQSADTADAIADLENLTADSFGAATSNKQGTHSEETTVQDAEQVSNEEDVEEVVDTETEPEDVEFDIESLVKESDAEEHEAKEPEAELEDENVSVKESVKQVKPVVHSSKLPPIAPSIDEEPDESVEDSKVESADSVKTSEAETKPKDGSDSLAAFLSNGVGFSVKF